MGFLGAMGLLLAFVASVASVLLLAAGQVLEARSRGADLAQSLLWAGRIVVAVCFAALTLCCGVLVFCFLTGDYTLQYVLDQHSRSTGLMGVLFNIAGLWAGREGSLLFWSWLISLFSLIVSLRRLDQLAKLDTCAVLVMEAVLAAFLGVLLFSDANAPFSATESRYYGPDGTLTTVATVMGMNTLLEHWAMAIHPPLLFVGYAGLTVPFAYAVSALVCNDYSKGWIDRSNRITLASWLFLTVGIGLGSVWAYVVLGWGGYWGWDPVENASLLPWLMGVALIHSMTMYRKRGIFKGWALLCACLTYGFVIVGTFISRSGLVQSVHAFEGDPVSLALFGALIAISFGVGITGVVLRRKSIGASEASSAPEACAPMGEGEAEPARAESLLTREDFYFFNNVFMVAATVLLTYLTVSSALPSFLPLGGQSLPAGAYNMLARPLGILYLLLMAVCPLLSWGGSDLRKGLGRLKVASGVCAVTFVLLMAYFVLVLSPSYDASLAAGGSIAADLVEQGPAWYYKGLTVVGLAVASQYPGAEVVLADWSEGALRVCRQNIRRCGVTDRVSAARVNALETPPPLLSDFDLILCNPPYIPTGDLAGLDVSVRDYEPPMALDGGEDGLVFYRSIARRWKPALRSAGRLIFEVGFDQAPAVEYILAAEGYGDIQTFRDPGGHWRVVEGTAV